MILFIDDEPHYILPFTQAFELNNFDVKIINNVDDAWKVIESSKRDLLAIIIDIMMPPGKLLEAERTKQGLRTGEVFIEKLRQFDEGIPVVVLTNAEIVDLVNIVHRNCVIFPKKEIHPWGLVDKVSEMKRKRF